MHTADGRIPADLVVLGLGVKPNCELAEAAGVELGARRSIKVDRRQQASVDGVWAAGDCAESFHRVSQRPVHVALGTIANRQGRVAGINIGGGYATFPGVVGTAVTKVCSTEVARTGLTELEAERDGFRAVAATIESTTRAGYFPRLDADHGEAGRRGRHRAPARRPDRRRRRRRPSASTPWRWPSPPA